MSPPGQRRPARIGPYEIVRRLGVGGMAEVFEARAHRAAGVVQPVCVKRILPAYARDRRFVRLFVREARVSFALHHGKIAQVFDFGHEGGEVYLVMELVDGRALSALLARLARAGRTLPVGHALKFVCDVLEALEHAHTRMDEHGRPLEIVHRDVSPQNVLLAFEGQVKLVDFGIARAAASAGVDPGAGAGGVQGKLPYLPPEQVRGEPGDARADLYAAGALLFELLAGRAPFVQTPEAARAALLLGAIPQLEEIAPQVDPELAHLTAWAMAARPEDRPESARAFLQELLTWAHARDLLASEREVGELMRWAFSAEFEASGREVELPPAFEKTLSRGVPDLQADASPSASRTLGIGLFLLVSMAAMGAFLYRGLVPQVEPWDLQLRTRPPGARVILDGEETGRFTDVLLRDLDRDRSHRIRVEHPGRQPAQARVLPGTPELLLVLEPTYRVQPLPERLPPEIEPEIEAPPPALWVETEASGARLLHLDLRRPVADASAWPLAFVSVDPKTRATMVVQGDVLVAIARKQDVAFYLAQDASGATLGAGLLRRAQPRRAPAGTARLGFAVLDGDTCHNNAEELRVRVQVGRRRLPVRVDGRANCVNASGQGQPTLKRLSGKLVFRITYLGPKEGPPLILVAFGTTALLALSRTPGDAMKEIGPGESVELPYIQNLVLLRLESNLAEIPEIRLRMEGHERRGEENDLDHGP